MFAGSHWYHVERVGHQPLAPHQLLPGTLTSKVVQHGSLKHPHNYIVRMGKKGN